MTPKDFASLHVWLKALFIGLYFSCCACPQTPALSVCSSFDNSVIAAEGSPSLFLLRDGLKYHIQTSTWVAKNGYGPVHVLKPSEVAAIPTGYELADQSPVPGSPAALEGNLISVAGRIYAVEHGEAHWVRDTQWISESRYAGHAALPVTEDKLQALSLGRDLEHAPPDRGFWIVFLTSVFCIFFLLSISGVLRRLLSPLFGWFIEDNVFKKVLLAACSAAIFLREPNLLSHPRFWAEEGAGWFYYASSHSFMKTLLFVYPASSYFNLTANVGALLSSRTAAMVGLDYAPTATTILAFLIQVLVMGLVLFGKSRLFNSLWKKVAGCLVVLFAPTTTDEIWLNTINSMSFLGLISVIMLFEETWNWPGWARWGSRGLFVLCGLSSPYAAALLPLFLVLAFHDKKREQYIQCVILISCVLMQAGVVMHTRSEVARTAGSQPRGTQVRLDASVVNVFFGHIAHPALGYRTREVLFEKTGLKEAWLSASSFPPHPMAKSLRPGAWLCFLLIGGLVWALRGPTLYSLSNILMVAFLILSIFTCLGSLYSVPLGRYAVLPGFTFLSLLLVNMESSRSRVVRYVSLFILSYGLATGISDYRSYESQNGPSWATEVGIWQTDHAHPLNIWPPGWSFTYTGP